MDKKKEEKEAILIIAPPFGYNTDWYQYAELLSNHYNVYYLCCHSGSKDIKSQKVNVVYYEANTRNYYYRVLLAARKLKKQVSFRRVFVYVYPSCSFMRLFFRKDQLVMDIRTSYIKSPMLTWICNKLVKLESIFYGKISVISWGVAEFLRLNKKNCYLLPLGGEKLKFVDKSMESLRLIYVGTFFDRHIEKTVDGFALFKSQHPDADVDYSIVGVGDDVNVKTIKARIFDYNLSDSVFFLGEKRGDELHNIMVKHNVGVSYIPLTDYYDCQPPTKTYEYLLGSMLVLATPTSENKKVINDNNGCLCESDSPEAFAKGLIYIYNQRKRFRLNEIYENSLQYSWENIVENSLVPIC